MAELFCQSGASAQAGWDWSPSIRQYARFASWHSCATFSKLLNIFNTLSDHPITRDRGDHPILHGSWLATCPASCVAPAPAPSGELVIPVTASFPVLPV